MGFGQLRRYDVQAKYALMLSVGSVIPFLGAVAITIRNYDGDLGHIVHGSKGLFLPVFLGCLGLSVVAGAIGAAFGLSSAGQRRNDKPAWSWIGFLLGSGMVTFDIILLIAYWMLRFTQTV